MNDPITIIDGIVAVLADLTANHNSMPWPTVRASRNTAISTGTALLNDPDLDIPHADYMRLYDAVIELDRIGY